MAKLKPNNGGKENDDGLALFVLAFLIGLIAWVLWKFDRAPFVRVIYSGDLVQYWVMKHLYDIGIPLPWGPKGEQMLRYVRACFDGRVNPGTVSFEEIYNTQTDIGRRIGAFFVAPTFIMTLLIGFRMRGGELKRTFTLSGSGKRKKWFWVNIPAGPLSIFPELMTRIFDVGFLRLGTWFCSMLGFRSRKVWTNVGLSFMRYQASYWKIATPGAEFDPNVENPNMAQSRTPPEWMRDNKVDIIDGILDDKSSNKAFAGQLGPVWESYETCPDYTKAILIIAWLTLQFFSNSDIVTKVRGDLAVAFTRNEKIRVRKILEECERRYPKMVRSINAVCGKHHYVNTAVLGFVSWSGPFEYWFGGQGSVNSPSMWLWLKQYDRTMWYTLQCYGRRVCFVEGAGAVSHFFYEKGVGQDESIPKTEEATKGLKKYLEYHHIDNLSSFFEKAKRRKDYVGEESAAVSMREGSENSLTPLERRKRMVEEQKKQEQALEEERLREKRGEMLSRIKAENPGISDKDARLRLEREERRMESAAITKTARKKRVRQ